MILKLPLELGSNYFTCEQWEPMNGFATEHAGTVAYLVLGWLVELNGNGKVIRKPFRVEMLA